jgi:hypothetical protein
MTTAPCPEGKRALRRVDPGKLPFLAFRHVTRTDDKHMLKDYL